MDRKEPKKISKTDNFIVDTFAGLVKLILLLVSFVLLAVLPLVLISLGVASLISKEWLKGLGYLALVAVSFYTARGLTKAIK